MEPEDQDFTSSTRIWNNKVLLRDKECGKLGSPLTLPRNNGTSEWNSASNYNFCGGSKQSFRKMRKHSVSSFNFLLWITIGMIVCAGSTGAVATNGGNTDFRRGKKIICCL